MASKVLLARFTRPKKGGKENETETLMPSGTPVDLSAEDLATLDKLAKSTGKRYYRDPVNESASAGERPDDGGTFDPTAFVSRNLSQISDDEIAELSADEREDALAAEKEGKNRASLIERLTAKPAGEGDNGSGEGEKDEGL